MKIIGERINGTRTQVKNAVLEGNAEFIQSLAKRQVEAGANWLDVNAGTAPDREPEDLVWLVRTVQSVVNVPLCLDSANPAALMKAIGEVGQKPLINSISGEPKRLENILPLAGQAGCSVIALAMDEKGIPPSTEERLAVIRRVIDETRRAGLPDEQIYVDPLVMTIATNTNSARIALNTLRLVHAEYPHVHLSCGLSNVSFGLPVRTLINQAFLTLALETGLDTAILDPMDSELHKALLAAEVVLGLDAHCLNYTRAYRSGVLEKE